MKRQTLGEIASVATTGVFLVCSLTMAGAALRRELRTVSPPPREAQIQKQADGASYAADGHRIGPVDARVVMVEFSDFQCPYCQRFEEQIRKTRERFPTEFAVVYRHFPLSMHKFARDAAIASECGGAQSRFEQMHDALFDAHDSLGTVPWTRIAARAGVTDTGTFARCMRDSTVGATVDRDAKAAKRAGAKATPTLLIDGVRVRGIVAQGTLDSLVLDAMQKMDPGRSQTGR